MDISSYIDYTLLSSSATERDVIELCDVANEHNFYSICINSCYVSLAHQFLHEAKTKICAVVGFPLGATATETKVFEALKAIKDGAEEIDMVINIGYLKSRNYVLVLKDIIDVKLAIGNLPLKVIIEISELSKNEIIKASEICLDAKVDFIKTSTGFTKSGATLTAVKMIKKTVKNKTKIKAFGGINDFDTAIKYIDAGAHRIGTTSVLKPRKSSSEIRNTKIYKAYVETVLNSRASTNKTAIGES